MNRKILEALELLKQEDDIVDELKSSSVQKALENKLEERDVEDVIEELEEENILEYSEDGNVVLRRFDKVKKNIYGNRKAVYGKYKEYFHIEDTKKIDLLLSIALSVGKPDKNIWLLFVGASGIGKSMITDPLRYVDKGGKEVAYMVSDMTTNTLVSGMASEGVSLAPELDGKIMYIPDFSTIVEKRSEDQREIFSQFRNLYDGFAKKETGGHGENKRFDVDVTLLGNVTPAIHNKNLIHQSMGTRFLYYEINDFAKKEVYDSIWDDDDGKSSEEISKEIGKVIQKFIDYRSDEEKADVPEDVKEKMEDIAEWTAKMRVTGQFDRTNDELRGSLNPEKPTRILKQFKKIYYNLKRLDDSYPDERAVSIIRKIGASSIDPDKRRIYIEIDQSESGLTLPDLVDRLGISRTSIKRSLMEMRNVGILKADFGMTDTGRLKMGVFRMSEDFEDMSKKLVS